MPAFMPGTGIYAIMGVKSAKSSSKAGLQKTDFLPVQTDF